MIKSAYWLVPDAHTDKVKLYESYNYLTKAKIRSSQVEDLRNQVKLALFVIQTLVNGCYLHLTTTNFSWWSNFCEVCHIINIQWANNQDESRNHWQPHRLLCGMWRRLKDWLLIIDSWVEIHTSSLVDCQVQDRALEIYWGRNTSLWLKALGLLYLLMLLVTITQAQNGPTPKWWNRVRVRVTDSCLWQTETSTHSSF